MPYVITIIDSEGRVWALEVNDGQFCGQILSGHVELGQEEFEQTETLLSDLPSPAEEWGADLWDKAVESMGRSAGVLEELAESTGEAIASIAAQGDRINSIKKDTTTLLKKRIV